MELSPELQRLIGQDKQLADILNKVQEKKEAKEPNITKYLRAYITTYPEIDKMKLHVQKLAPVDDPVLILGESGTGKELLARALHGERKGPFVAVNCSSIAPTLIEAELFGSKKGSYTGSTMDRVGYLEKAQDGTLFLDEIGDLPIHVQGTLLRAVQEHEINPVGSTKGIEINCRVVTATHRNLEDWARRDLFRNDLFQRISTFIIRTLPLSVRALDWPLIVTALDKDSKIENVKAFCARIDKDKLTGNVRTLQQYVRRYYVLGMLPDYED